MGSHGDAFRSSRFAAARKVAEERGALGANQREKEEQVWAQWWEALGLEEGAGEDDFGYGEIEGSPKKAAAT